MKTSSKLLALLVSAAAAGTALASDRLSEAGYLKAARCQGLAHAQALGPVDTTTIDTLMRVQGEGRDASVRNRARALRAEAAEDASRPANGARLLKERNARCAAWVQSQEIAASGGTAAR
jgi:hypothetical protein